MTEQSIFQELITQFTNGNRKLAFNEWQELPPDEQRGFILYAKDMERSDLLANFILRLI